MQGYIIKEELGNTLFSNVFLAEKFGKKFAIKALKGLK
jgi:hypothetical protein